MLIQSSKISLTSQHQATKFESETEQLHYWKNSTKNSASEKAISDLKFKTDKISISYETRQASTVQSTKPTAKNRALDNDEISEDLQHDWKLNLLRRLISQLTGKEITTKVSDFKTEDNEQIAQTAPETTQKNEAGELEGWGLEYSYQHSYYESEQTSFNTQGIVNTADGREIKLNLQLNMSREFASHESINIRAGDALKDPLVINYAGTAAQLETTDLQFDIDLDGSLDQMKFVTAGSGFLALDKNQDGQINDGSELFGPKSGDGFAELAAYDNDNNQWIDENDTIFDQLRIWERSPTGETSLIALGQRGIGAIYLDRVATPFSLNDQQNDQLGQIRTSGVFLNENGTAGTIQQLDLVV